jgi:mannose-1-phosphate guanylyltransferase/mannose-6-phosphate isomerase
MTKNLITPVILSGGAGSRLWPVSRHLRPKQFLKILSDQSLFSETINRVASDRFEDLFSICSEDHRFLVAEEIRLNDAGIGKIVCEPIARNTAPAIAAVATILANEAPSNLMLVLPSDHVIQDVDAFHQVVETAASVAEEGFLATFGIEPTSAETGYGYIEAGDPVASVGGSYAVKKFAEKPDQKTAEHYLKSGKHVWNSGMFLFSPTVFLEEITRLQPAIINAVKSSIDQASVEGRFIHLQEQSFSEAPSLSVDVAVMERTDRAVVVPVEMGWNDVGAWPALYEANSKDASGNVVTGDVLTHDTKNSYVSSDGVLVATVGVENLIVVATDDAVLVTSQTTAQEVRHIVEQLRQSDRHEHYRHSTVYRPWGNYRNLQENPGYLTKEIVVNPGAKLSLQYHHHRAEHWVVVEGQAIVTNGDEILTLDAGQSTYIPLGATHRLENQGDKPLRLIEVQVGDYIGEDDIVRVEDDFGRN